MRKTLYVLLFSFLALGMSSCKEQEATEKFEIENLVGTWELSSTKTYDREAKFLEQIFPSDDYGCGLMTWTYTTDKIDILQFVGKDENGNCLEKIVGLNYTLQNNNINTLDELGIEEKMLITNLTNDELVVMVSLPNPVKEDANSIKYTEISYKRIK